jgi:DNA-binding NtrC family response regulator
MPTAHVLVVDDDRDVLETIRQMLRMLGHTVGTALSAIDGLIAMTPTAPDLVLLDLGMPGIDGLDALPYFRHHHPAVPIVVLTAVLQPDTLAHARALGAFEILQKPVRMQDLVDAIDRATRKPPPA